ncbi:calcium and integrin-binding family member 3 [Chelonus insularis]|uniref:calcium and integrin-binding family member 3 n=1 Tax=Chelonus insularis TaxID=460826 RepID=UPI001589538C|nr:calcium and integrin-binding family member 3 [Chelonus insularis]
MGNKIAIFSEEQLEDYQDCTFFTRKEILRIFERFRDMGETGVVPKVMTSEEALRLKLPLSSLAKIPEFKENPFRERIADVFTSSHDLESSKGICFNEFLEMMSVFSEQAPRDLKVFYAFKIYDFDDDGVIGINDLEKTCRHLVKDGLNSDEVSTICRKVLEESDIDCDDALSYLEFEHVVTRASDFLSTFHIRI